MAQLSEHRARKKSGKVSALGVQCDSLFQLNSTNCEFFWKLAMRIIENVCRTMSATKRKLPQLNDNSCLIRRRFFRRRAVGQMPSVCS